MNGKDLKSVHILGVCGTLMAPFAAFLKQKGLKVSGTDQNVYPPMSDVLEQAGIQLFSGYDPQNVRSLSVKPDLVVVGNVIRRDNPEVRYVMDESGIEFTSLPEFFEKNWLKQTHNVVISGTHGKTTTSSMMAHVLSSLGLQPSYFIGGVCYDLPSSFHYNADSSSKYFVLEGDEYDTAFWDKVPKFTHYIPKDVILTSVEFDHADIYDSMESVSKAFSTLVKSVPKDGKLIVCWDYAESRKILSSQSRPIVTYGVGEGVDYRLDWDNDSKQFQIFQGKQEVDRFSLRSFGTHNGLNALSVWIWAKEQGLDLENVKKALSEFKGVKRRQDIRLDQGGLKVIEDFAHHPTAVKTTLESLKQKYSDSRIVAIFEPRSATSRRNIFQNEYEKAFSYADRVWIAKPHDQEGIPEHQRFSSETLVSSLNSKYSVEATYFDSVDEAVKKMTEERKPNDVFVVLSNGSFGGLISKLIDQLKI